MIYFLLFALHLWTYCSMVRTSKDITGSLVLVSVSHPKCKQKFSKMLKSRIGEKLKLSFGLTTGVERVLKLLWTDCFWKRGKLWFPIFYLCLCFQFFRMKFYQQVTTSPASLCPATARPPTLIITSWTRTRTRGWSPCSSPPWAPPTSRCQPGPGPTYTARSRMPTGRR